MDEAGNSVEPEALTALTGFVGTKGNQIYVEQEPFYKIKKLQLVGYLLTTAISPSTLLTHAITEHEEGSVNFKQGSINFNKTLQSKT